ncbi:MAG: hypothetical protein ACK41T_10620 [Pseudobdellovibrio sp.]
MSYYRKQGIEPLNIGINKIESDSDHDVPADKNLLASGVAPHENFVDKPSVNELNHEAENQLSYKFTEHLKMIGECLHIQNSQQEQKTQPTYDNLIISLRSALGDVVVQMDDWTQLDLQNRDGSKKRIRTEVNYDNPSAPVKYVQFYSINEQGLPELQPIDKEKAKNPTDEYINYLRADSSLIFDKRGSRAYFSSGESLAVVERSGYLESVILSKENKSIKCSDLNNANSQCVCN